MSWQTVALAIGVLMLLCSFAAVHRWLNIIERRHGGPGLDVQLANLRRELEDMKKAFFSTTTPRKASF